VEKKQQAYTENCKYDTIQYIYVRSKADEMASLSSAQHRNEKNKENKIVAQKKPSGQQSVKAVREDEVKLRGRICETGRF